MGRPILRGNGFPMTAGRAGKLAPFLQAVPPLDAAGRRLQASNTVVPAQGGNQCRKGGLC